MPANRVNEYLSFANLQMAAEALLVGLPTDKDSAEYKQELTKRLVAGNGHASRFSQEQARQFAETYIVIDHKANTQTGFSGTLFKNRDTGELTLSLRSTEFIDDSVRDNKATNQLEIQRLGWALGQIADMEDWYRALKSNALVGPDTVFNVTGYSLGGHLATAFSLLRSEAGEFGRIAHVYTFNGAGVGGLLPGKQLTDMIARFVRMRDDPASIDWTGFSEFDRAFIFSKANSRIQDIIDEQNRLSAFTQTFFNPPLQSIRDQVSQKDLAYQVAALLAAMDTIPSSQFFASDVNTIPVQRIFAPTLFGNMTEIFGQDGGQGGASFVAFSGIHYGANSVPVYIEDQPLIRGNVLGALTLNLLRDNPSQNDFGDTHSLVLLVDSLSVMSTLAELDPTLTQDAMERILRSVSNAKASSLLFTQGRAEGDTLEHLLAALGDLTEARADPAWKRLSPNLSGNSWWQLEDGIANTGRNTFHSNLRLVNDRIKGLTIDSELGFTVVPLDEWSANDLTGTATDPLGVAYRYALKQGNPFAVAGQMPIYASPLYANFDRDLAAEGLTSEEIRDRSAMLAWSMLRNIRNEGDLVVTPQATEFAHFSDARRRENMPVLDFRVAPEPIQSNVVFREISFGAGSVDLLYGDDLSDRLYGGIGTDYLTGKSQNDHLEGGTGLDLYQYRAFTVLGSISNDGADTIRDTDGRGVIRYTLGQSNVFSSTYTSTVIADASDRRSDTEWRSADGKFIYVTSPNAEGHTDLTVTFSDGAGGAITLKDFRDGDFGIRLRGPVGPPAGAARTFYGDRQNWDSDPSQDGVQPQLDGFGNYVRADGQDGRPDLAELDRADDFYGSDQDEVERFATSGGNDVVHADGTAGQTGGADLIEAGAGRDVVWAGPGDDFVEGGADGTSIELAGGQSTAVAGGDVVNSGPGNDAVYGLNHIELASAIRNSESETSLNLKGDFLSSGDGNDRLIGSTENDALLGGSGDDVLLGGAGNDNLWGDLAHGSDTLAWSATRSVLPPSEGTPQRTFDIQFTNVLIAPLPQGGGDAIYGGAGADWSFGGGGDDFIDGGSGADVSFGQAGSDILIGGAGNDVLSGDDPATVFGEQEGADYVDGGAGDDELFGNGGEDILVGGPGKDTLVGGAGKDIYVFGKGDGVGGDVVFDTPAHANDPEKSELVLGDGVKPTDVKFFPGSLGIDLGPSDPEDPSSPHDVIHFGGFDPFNPYATPVLGAIHFADGASMTFDDILAQGFDIDGTQGADNEHLGGATLRGTAVVDRIRGFGGDDLLVGLAGDDVLDAGDGADELQGGDGNDSLAAGAGSDNLFGEAGDDTISGGDGNDVLVGDAGNDVLGGDAAPDSMWGGAGDDALYGDSENDTLYGNDGADTLEGGSGDDTLYAHAFVFVDGVPMLNPLDDDAADVLRGDSGDDYLNSGGGGDWLEGGSGADVLDAEAGDDVLAGGPGNDGLQGGAGSDFYVFNLGDAHDTLYDAGPNTVTFGAAIDAASLSLWQTGSDLNIGHFNGTDVLTVANWYANADPAVSGFEFADGSVWSSTFAGAEGAKTKRGTPGNDSIFGGAINETISGLGGNDQLFGNGGADTLAGGAGDDTTSGGDGADTYRFELGDGRDVVMESGQGADALLFGPGIAKADVQASRAGNDLVLAHLNGTDKVTIKDWFNDATKQVESITFVATGQAFTPSELIDPFLLLSGTPAADFLSGGSAYGETILGLAGNDELHGGGGNDSLTGGLGNDSLFGEGGNDRYFFVAGDGQDVLADPTGLNVIQFGPNLANKASIGASGFDQLISFTGTNDSILVKTGGFFPTLAFELVGTNGADSLTGSDYKDIVSGLGGNDSVKGGQGIDEIHGGPGNDVLEGGLHIDDLWGDDGDDLLDGDLLNDPFAIEGGYITRFRGGPGNDTMYGSTAADSYYFDPGDAQDVVVDEPLFANGLWRYSLSDDLIFGSGITADAIGAHPLGADLVVDVSATDRVTLKNWLGDPKYRVDVFRFGDGSSMNETQIADLINVRQGTSGNDTLTGSDAGSERMYGKAGNDTLTGLGGDDLLDGGVGNDLLDGGAGNDTYIVRPGDGADLIRETAGSDAIQFGTGISAGNVTLERSGNNLLLRGPVGNDTVAIENFLKDSNSRIETFLFTDGSSLPDSGTIVEQLTSIRGTLSADSLVGTVYADRLYGMDGNDTLSGGGDDDVLNGDAGNDSLGGGAGADLLAGGVGLDRYQFNLGDGSDTVSDPDTGNVVQFGVGIAPQNTVTTRTGDDLLLSVSGTADRLSIPGYFVGYPVAEFRFTDGTVWSVDAIKTKVTTPTSGADTLIGFETNDSISGLAGADTIYGRGGSDTLDGGLGSDALYGEDGNDTLIAGMGESKNAAVSNSLYGGNGDDVLIGGGNVNSVERLDGGPGADLLLGGIGQEIIDDTGYDGRNGLLFGGAGADTMRMYGGAGALAIGGAGNDRISGGLGAGVAKTRIIVAFNKADGIETVDQLAFGSTITVGGGALYGNLSLEVSGTGLRLKTASSNYVYLSDWYSGTGGKSVATLQVVIEGTRDYKPTSSNPMNNAKIVAFDFIGLVSAFDAARAAGKTFDVAANLASHRIWSSNTDAIGGVMTYQYAKSGSLGTLTHEQMRAVLDAAAFGGSPQPIMGAASPMASAEDVAATFSTQEGAMLATRSSAGEPDMRTESAQDSVESARSVSLGKSTDHGFPAAQATGYGDFATRAGIRALPSPPVDLANASVHADAWRRVARGLPVHLKDDGEPGLAAHTRGWNETIVRGSGVSASVVAAVGITDAGLHRLLPFDGLKEGFAQIA